MAKDMTTYYLSDRWRDYKTHAFNEKTQRTDTRGLGFTKKNWEEKTGRKRRKQSKPGIKGDTRTSNKNDTRKREYQDQLVSNLVQGDLDVNFFIKKGEEVLRAFSSSRHQKRYCSITSHTN